MLIGGDLGHGKVRLGQDCAFGVDTDENFGDSLDIEVVGEFNEADLFLGDIPSGWKALLQPCPHLRLD